MLSIEAPIHLYEFRSLNELAFNWTMTYRLDSDFPIPYAWIDRVQPLPGPVGSARHVIFQKHRFKKNLLFAYFLLIINCTRTLQNSLHADCRSSSADSGGGR